MDALRERGLLFRPGSPPASPARYSGESIGLVLFTGDLAGTKRALESRGLVFEGDDGPGCPTFQDPDGHCRQLVDPRHA